MADIQGRYKELKKKYALPDYKALNDEFEICQIEKDDFLLREIRRIITEKLEYVGHIIEQIFQPDSNSLAGMHEWKSLTEEEKKRLFEVYRNVMMLHREALVVALSHQENEEGEFIAKIFKEWPGITSELKGYLNKMREFWGKESEPEESIGYFG